MGDYISQSDLEETLSNQRVRMLTDDDGTGAIDSSVVTRAITSAEAEVNAFVAKQYTVPVTGTIPDPLSRWSIVLATLILYQRRPPVPDDVKDAATECRVQLNQLAKGEISLDIGTGTATESTGFEPEFDYETRQFTRTKYIGY